jgi:hypothetical protein
MNATQYLFDVGTVSHATLQDFAIALAIHESIDFANSYRNAGIDMPDPYEGFDGFDGDDPFWDSGESSYYVNETLFPLMGEHAPPYCYFGSHPGDGSDIGFWPCMESIGALPKVEDSDEARELGEDCAFVNDHGNVTVYGGDGSVLWEVV